MKRFFVLLIVLATVFLFACRNRNSEKDNTEDKMINYKIGIYHDKNWTVEVGTYQGDAIPNEEVAVMVATQIFNGMDKNIAERAYIPQQVFYDEEDEVWIVSFWPKIEEAGLITVGSGCSIAMQKKDGKVLRIWFGE